MNPFETILLWAENNIFILAMLGLVIYFGYNYLHIKRKEVLKPVNRAEIERQNMVDRLKLNTSKRYKWLFKGNNLLGKIINIIGTKVQANPHPVETLSIVFQPMLLKRPIKIVNPFAKKQVVVIDEATIVYSEDYYGKAVETNWIMVKDTVAISKYMGIYYTVGNTETMIKDNIRDFDTFKTDLNNLSSIYFVKSQEQSTYQPQYAHELALKEKEIQLMMAQKKGKSETI